MRKTKKPQLKVKKSKKIARPQIVKKRIAKKKTAKKAVAKRRAVKRKTAVKKMDAGLQARITYYLERIRAI